MASSQSQPWWRPLVTSDRRAIWALVLLPTLIFAVPALLGHPAIAQDNHIQNYPLRYLSGLQIRSGHLPLFNPLANSGTPLLGGMNSGSLYPLTVIFAVLPPLVAWVINLVAVYLTASLGVFALLRWMGLRTSSALVAGLVFAYSGAMMGQMVHLAVVQGFALLPWMVLVQLHLSRVVMQSDSATWRLRLRTVLPSVLGFAAIWGLTFLTGEPRAIAELELVALVVIAVQMFVHHTDVAATWRSRRDVILANGAGALIGVGVGLVQLLPGWSFIGESQRSVIDYWFFGSGSLNTKWTILLFMQDAFGGNQVLGFPHYFNNYNLAEVTGFVGIVALTATAAFFASLTRRGWRGPERQFTVFGVLAIVGLLAAWGSYTPLGHLFHALPFFGKTRLQSRNIIVFDLAAAVFVGWWLDALVRRQIQSAALAGRRRWAAATPALITLALGVVMIVATDPFYRFMDVKEWLLPQAHFVRVNIVIHMVLAVAVLAVIFAKRLQIRPVRWLLAVMAIDLALFNLFCDVSFYQGQWPVQPNATTAAHTLLAGDGRTAMIDRTFANYGAYLALGATNTNVFTRIPSVQGYGSLVSRRYDNATHVHPLLGLDPCAVASGRTRQLDLRTILIARSSLSEPLTPTTVPVTECGPIDDAVYHTRAFGEPLEVRRILVTTNNTSRPVAVGVMGKDGNLFYRVVVRPDANGRIDVQLPSSLAAGYGIEVNSLSDTWGFTVRHAEVVVRDGTHLRLDEPFQIAMSQGDWYYVDTRDGYAQYRSEGSGRFWTNLELPRSAVHHHQALWGDEWASWNSSLPVTLWRSTAWLPGWRATATNLDTGEERSVVVRRSDLIQKVSLPSGHWRVHFHYHAPHIAAGLLVSVVSVLFVVVSALTLSRGARRRRASLTA